jgi:xylulokinase
MCAATNNDALILGDALFLGIDSSTQSMTGVLIDPAGGDERQLLEVSIRFDDHFRDAYGIQDGVVKRGNEVWSNPLMWVEALDLLMTQLKHKADEDGWKLDAIKAVAVSGQQHGTVYLNEKAEGALGGLSARGNLKDQLSGIFSRPESPIWMDSSTREQCERIERDMEARGGLLNVTGNRAFERFSGPQIRKFFEQRPEQYAATRQIALVSSFIASLLAGKVAAVDATDGSGTNLIDIRTRQWSSDALRATADDLQSKLRPITPSGSEVGPISPYFCEKYGFAGTCRVFPGAGDNPSSLIGLGLVRPGQMGISLGTSDTLFVCVAEPRVCTTGEGCLFGSPDDRNYMALICFKNGSLTRDTVRKQYQLSWDEFGALLRSTPMGDDPGIILSYPEPEIVPDVPRSFWLYHGLSPREVGRCVRAIVESRALSARIHSEWMGAKVESIRITGGASANADICQVFADVFGVPVESIKTTSSAALGAALRACHGHRATSDRASSWDEVVEPFTKPTASAKPNPQVRAAYDALLETYRAIEKAHTSPGA